jgi:hypothetical protein
MLWTDDQLYRVRLGGSEAEHRRPRRPAEQLQRRLAELDRQIAKIRGSRQGVRRVDGSRLGVHDDAKQAAA